MAEFKFTIGDVDEIFDEKGNTYLALRTVAWGDSTNPKLELRKWYANPNGDDTCGKGFTFLTEEGPNNLVNTLLKQNYGDTEEVIESIKDREDFMSSLVKVINKEDLEAVGISLENVSVSEEIYYDPSAILE